MQPHTIEKCREPSRTKPWLEDWPIEGLEAVKLCPVCDSGHRMQLYSNLIDNVFYTALGRWTLYRCQGCGSAYLDPRPTPEFIHLAYRNYYTHEAFEPRAPLEALSVFRRLRRALANGYTNRRYGTCRLPASRLGTPAAWMMPPLRRLLDQRFRYLPRPIPGSRLLDVGFGSGAFLDNAMAAGWEVAGVDPDEKAVANANARGLNVCQGGIEAYVEEPESFDAITLSHVIEHVYDPIAILQGVFRLLKTGGMLYLETPNIESLGHKTFGPSWRGLEPPRHLVIFCRNSILRVIEEAGFNSIRFLTRPNEYLYMFKASYCIANHQDPYGKESPSIDWNTRIASLRGHIQPSKQELVTLVAIKSKKQ